MRILWLVPVLVVAACSPDYPMDKKGTWSLDTWPSSNDSNLRAMVVDPHDLVQGRGEPNSLAVEAAAPVKRLVTGKRYPLPASDVDDLSIGNSTPTPPGGDTNAP
jgi:hypothetical protein